MNSNIRDAGNFLLARPLASIRQGVAQSIPNSTWTACTFDTEDIDRDNGHSTVSNTSRYTGATPGYVWTAYTAAFALSSAGGRAGRIRLNGADSSQTAGTGVFHVPPSALVSVISGGGLQYLNGTSDYLELVVLQTSGGALNTYVATDVLTRLSVLWVSS